MIRVQEQFVRYPELMLSVHLVGLRLITGKDILLVQGICREEGLVIKMDGIIKLHVVITDQGPFQTFNAEVVMEGGN